jgi:hypothetical protein
MVPCWGSLRSACFVKSELVREDNRAGLQFKFIDYIFEFKKNLYYKLLPTRVLN